MLIVAEIGSNHMGDLGLALEHIEEAAKCGAGAVKFQVFRASYLDSRVEVQEKLRKYEVPDVWIPELSAVAHGLGMKFIVTPFDLGVLHWIRGEVDMVKIASSDLVYEDLVRGAAGLGVPVILSTGMATEEEIRQATLWVWHDYGTFPTLLHCTASYPCEMRDCNMARLGWLAEKFPACLVGYSCHTPMLTIGVAAFLLGCSLIEVHFRLEEGSEGSPDYRHSWTPRMLRDLVTFSDATAIVMGKEERDGPDECEREVYETCRRTNVKRLRG